MAKMSLPSSICFLLIILMSSGFSFERTISFLSPRDGAGDGSAGVAGSTATSGFVPSFRALSSLSRVSTSASPSPAYFASRLFRVSSTPFSGAACVALGCADGASPRAFSAKSRLENERPVTASAHAVAPFLTSTRPPGANTFSMPVVV